jgi:hypothetical protein
MGNDSVGFHHVASEGMTLGRHGIPRPTFFHFRTLMYFLLIAPKTINVGSPFSLVWFNSTYCHDGANTRNDQTLLYSPIGDERSVPPRPRPQRHPQRHLGAQQTITQQPRANADDPGA